MEKWLKKVKPEWRDEFRKFMKGEPVSADFLAYCEQDADCQKAVNAAIDEAFKLFANLI